MLILLYIIECDIFRKRCNNNNKNNNSFPECRPLSGSGARRMRSALAPVNLLRNLRLPPAGGSAGFVWRNHPETPEISSDASKFNAA